jgi:hypothetical protein
MKCLLQVLWLFIISDGQPYGCREQQYRVKFFNLNSENDCTINHCTDRNADTQHEFLT